MSLNIIVVGAGIAGLSAAVALRQAGHSVKVFEKSKFAAEVGAALVLSSNGSRVLRQLGFDFRKARCRKVTQWDTVDGISLESIVSLDLKTAEERFGAPIETVHRVDLHSELLRLAAIKEDGMQPLELRLASKVVDADAEAGTIELADGSVHTADLIVAADGLHSVLKPLVLGKENIVAAETGMSAFRFLTPTSVFGEDADLKRALESKCKGVTILADTADTVRERHMVWYDCQDGEVQNLVGIHPSCAEDEGKKENFIPSLLREFGHFHPNIRKIIEQASDISIWPLYVHEPISTWSREKIMLIGDAAHPMLPFGGQGSNQAIEDAGALGFLLQGVGRPDMLPERLQMFEEVRQKRAARVQILSKVRSGKEEDITAQLEAYADPPGSAVPRNFPERNVHDYGFNVYEKCKEVLQRRGPLSLVPLPAGSEKQSPLVAKIHPTTTLFRALIINALSAARSLFGILISALQGLLSYSSTK